MYVHTLCIIMLHIGMYVVIVLLLLFIVLYVVLQEVHALALALGFS